MDSALCQQGMFDGSSCSLIPGFFDYGCGWNESICVPQYDVPVNEFACHCDAGWGGLTCNDTTISYYDFMEFFEENQDCDSLSPAGSFEQCGRDCVPRETCPPSGCECLGFPDKWQMCNGRCVPTGECLETACAKLSVDVNQTFGACNGSCVAGTCNGPFVNMAGVDWITIEASAALEIATSAVIDEVAMKQTIAEAVGVSIGVRSEAIDVVFTSIEIKIRSQMVVYVAGDLNSTLFEQALALAFSVEADQVSLESSRRSLQSTRNVVPFSVSMAGGEEVFSLAVRLTTLIASTTLQATLTHGIRAVGHPELQSLTVTQQPEIMTTMEYIINASGVPNVPGAQEAISVALGPASGGASATLAGLILRHGAIPGATILFTGVAFVSVGVAAEANTELIAPPPPVLVDNSTAGDNSTTEVPVEWEIIEDEENEMTNYANPLIMVYLVGGTLVFVGVWVKLCNPLFVKVCPKANKVRPYDAGTDSDEEKPSVRLSRNGARCGALVSYDAEAEDEPAPPGTSSTILAKRGEFEREAAALRNQAKFGDDGSVIGDDNYSYYSEDARPLSPNALIELEVLRAKAMARAALRTPVTPPIPRIHKATDVRGKLKERRQKKVARLSAMAKIDEKLRQAADERSTKGTRKLQRELLKEKELLGMEAAAHNQDFDGLDGKKKKKKGVRSRKAQAVWTTDRKRLQDELKGRRPKSRLNELKDRAVRLKMKEAVDAQSEPDMGAVPPLKSWDTVLVRQYLNNDQLQAEEAEMGSPLSSPTGRGWHAAAFFAEEEAKLADAEAKRGEWG